MTTDEADSIGLASFAEELDFAATRPLSNAANIGIAAAMLQIARKVAHGDTINDASAEKWAVLLRPIRQAGFDAIELSCLWLDLAALTADRRAEFSRVVSDLGLSIPGYLVANRSVIDAAARSENVRFSHAAIEAAAQIGAAFVCFGLHAIPPRRPGDPYWFWNIPTARPSMANLQEVALIFRELAKRASDCGVQIALEMYPDTLVGSAESALRFLEQVDHPAFSLNPDFGNFVRVQGPTQDWQELALRVLPHTRYWHVKNYARLEHLLSNIVLTHPAPLVSGVIDYRKAVTFARSVGFQGTIVCEHYGGDGLGVSSLNRQYLRELLE